MAVCQSHYVETAGGSGFGHGSKIGGRYDTKYVENGDQTVTSSIPVDRAVSNGGKVDDSWTNMTLTLRISETGVF